MYVVSTATVIAVEWTLLGIGLALIFARLYLRLHLERKCLILSDYFLCLAWLSGTWEAAADLELQKLGWLSPSITWLKLETNTNSSPLAEITEKILFMSWFPLLTTLYLNKAALLALFFYVFPSVFRTISYPLWIVTIYSGLSYLVSFVLVFLSCLPGRTKQAQFPACGGRTQFSLWIVTLVLHFLSDIFIFVLPFSFLRNIQLNRRKRLGLYITFGFGVLSMSACLLRFVIVVVNYPNVSTTDLELLCAIDAYVGVIVACLPSLRPYLSLKHVIPPQPHFDDDPREWYVLDRPPG